MTGVYGVLVPQHKDDNPQPPPRWWVALLRRLRSWRRR
jgi:hypothetical protein